jgi:hypothetical protein
MNIEQLLKQTREDIDNLQQNGSNRRYPQSIKDSIITLSKHTTPATIVTRLGVSRSFVSALVKRSKQNRLLNITTNEKLNDDKNKQKSEHPDTINIIHNEKTSENLVPNLDFLDITEQLKSLTKEDKPEQSTTRETVERRPLNSNLDPDNITTPRATPLMKFTTKSGITVEIFS